MSASSLSGFGAADLVATALSQPAVSLVLALIVWGSILVFHRSRGPRRVRGGADAVNRSVLARYLPERRTLGVVAIAVVVLVVADYYVRGYLPALSGLFAWWRFATPLLAALVGVGILLVLVLTRGTQAPEAPVVSAAPRTWLSFSPRLGMIASGIAAVLLLATTIAAGLASSANGEGQYVWLEIPVPNEAAIDPVRLGFYGWAYGLPVLISQVVLLALVWSSLHANAARPFIGPATVAAESRERRGVAVGVARVATAAMLLSLAGAWRLIASAGSSSSLVILGQNGGAPYEIIWRHAELAVLAGWCAPVVEVAGFVLLLLVATSLRGPSLAAAPEPARADAKAVV